MFQPVRLNERDKSCGSSDGLFRYMKRGESLDDLVSKKRISGGKKDRTDNNVTHGSPIALNRHDGLDEFGVALVKVGAAQLHNTDGAGLPCRGA